MREYVLRGRTIVAGFLAGTFIVCGLIANAHYSNTARTFPIFICAVGLLAAVLNMGVDFWSLRRMRQTRDAVTRPESQPVAQRVPQPAGGAPIPPPELSLTAALDEVLTSDQVDSDAEGDAPVDLGYMRRYLEFWLWLLAYSGAVVLLGFVIGSLLFLVVFLRVHARMSLLAMAITLVAVYGAMRLEQHFLGVIFLQGRLFS